MDALSKLCAKLDYHIARARLWKQAAKKWREFALDLKAGDNDMAEFAREQVADADRLRELLRRVEWIPDANNRKKYDWCPICENLRGTGHAADCELEKELYGE